uniref:Uncharacterized protein n=1 Tax=Arundo donax TaxID=35708 RepID=A0A0A8ZCD6_ARUDO
MASAPRKSRCAHDATSKADGDDGHGTHEPKGLRRSTRAEVKEIYRGLATAKGVGDPPGTDRSHQVF